MTVTASELERFALAIEAHLGLRVVDRPTVMTEILTRRAASRHETTASYLRRVDEAEPEELRALVAEVSVGETYFFRHAEQFHAYADLLPGLAAARGQLRVLSAGCSSGEEPYTLAILARERLPDPHEVAVHAFDFNPTALERAARARYTRWAMRATPAEHERRWFRPEGRELVLIGEIRDAVAFSEANLLDPTAAWARSQWDVVFCRNVLMYLGEARARGVVERLARSLVPGGYLFLGHAETLRDHLHHLELCHTHGTFYYRRSSRPATSPVVVGQVHVESAPPDRPPEPDGGAWIGDIAAATRRVHEMVDGALSRRVTAPGADALAPVQALVAEERFAEALDVLARLPESVAHGPDAMLVRAVVLTQTGDVAAAEATCRELLAIDGRSASAHYVLAMCRGDIGDIASSERHAREALVRDPSFAMASVQLAFLARRAGDRRSAIDHLERALDLLDREDPSRLALFGGGFGRGALVALCRAELEASRRER
jgi:chemotaxis protein methyltransferase CheR